MTQWCLAPAKQHPSSKWLLVTPNGKLVSMRELWDGWNANSTKTAIFSKSSKYLYLT